jgi:hypothetical protein
LLEILKYASLSWYYFVLSHGSPRAKKFFCNYSAILLAKF